MGLGLVVFELRGITPAHCEKMLGARERAGFKLSTTDGERIVVRPQRQEVPESE